MKRVKFSNNIRPRSHFDIIKIEEMSTKDYTDHKPTDFHIVEFYVIIFIENGKGLHSIDFEDYTCKKGTVLTVRKDQIHKFGATGSLSGKLILFTDEFLVSYLEEMESNRTLLLFNELLSSPRFHLRRSDYDDIYQGVNRISHEYVVAADKYSSAIIRSELHILLTKLFRIKAKDKDIEVDKKYLKEFLEFQKLAESLTFSTTKVKDYAQYMGKSTKTLNTITKSIVHKSAKEFVDDICIYRIKRLLINTQLSVKEIAYEAGFQETTNFYKYFRRQTNMTPEQFRADR